MDCTTGQRPNLRPKEFYRQFLILKKNREMKKYALRLEIYLNFI